MIILNGLDGLEGLRGLKGLEGLEELEGLDGLEGLEGSHLGPSKIKLSIGFELQDCVFFLDLFFLGGTGTPSKYNRTILFDVKK